MPHTLKGMKAGRSSGCPGGGVLDGDDGGGPAVEVGGVGQGVELTAVGGEADGCGEWGGLGVVGQGAGDVGLQLGVGPAELVGVVQLGPDEGGHVGQVGGWHGGLDWRLAILDWRF